ncbi:MAG: hypothetical protein RL477_652, partial [Pseudomonadota bacterium]
MNPAAAIDTDVTGRDSGRGEARSADAALRRCLVTGRTAPRA